MEINLELLKQIIGDKECQIVLLRQEIQRLRSVISMHESGADSEIAKKEA